MGALKGMVQFRTRSKVSVTTTLRFLLVGVYSENFNIVNLAQHFFMIFCICWHYTISFLTKFSMRKFSSSPSQSLFENGLWFWKHAAKFWKHAANTITDNTPKPDILIKYQVCCKTWYFDKISGYVELTDTIQNILQTLLQRSPQTWYFDKTPDFRPVMLHWQIPPRTCCRPHQRQHLKTWYQTMSDYLALIVATSPANLGNLITMNNCLAQACRTTRHLHHYQCLSFLLLVLTIGFCFCLPPDTSTDKTPKNWYKNLC